MIFSALLIVVALLLINAVYVAAEFSAVSARRSRIRQLAEDGNVLAAWLLPLVESPAALDRYIAACQIGITLSSLILGAFAQRTIAVWLTPLVTDWGGMQDVAAQSTSAGRSPAGADGRPGHLRGAHPEISGAAAPDANGALHARADGAVSVGVSPVHQVVERFRRAPPSAARIAFADPSTHSLTGRDRAPDCRKPGRRSPRARRTPSPAARATAQSRDRRSSSWCETPHLRARHRYPSRTGHGCCRAEPVSRGCPSIETPSTTSWGCFTPRTSSGGASAARTTSPLPPC